MGRAAWVEAVVHINDYKMLVRALRSEHRLKGTTPAFLPLPREARRPLWPTDMQLAQTSSSSSGGYNNTIRSFEERRAPEVRARRYVFRTEDTP